MIGYIEGTVLQCDENKALIKTTYGVGYEVYYRGMAKTGSLLNLFTAHVIREQSQELFGFKTLIEKDMFNMLLSVNGVGPKSAFSLVTTVGVDGVKKAIVFEEKKVLTQAPGIGPKAAAQIILNLKDKVAGMGAIDLVGAKNHMDPTVGRTLDEVVQACSELGFNASDVVPMVRDWIQSEPESTPESLIKKVLQEMAR